MEKYCFPEVFKTPIEGSLLAKNFFRGLFPHFLKIRFFLFHLGICRGGDNPPHPKHILSKRKQKFQADLHLINQNTTSCPTPTPTLPVTTWFQMEQEEESEKCSEALE